MNIILYYFKVFFTPEKEAARRKASVHVPIAMAYKPTTMKPPASKKCNICV